MAVTINGLTGADPDGGRTWVRRAILHMVHAFGYLDATDESLEPR